MSEIHEAVVRLLDKLDLVSDATLGIFSLAKIHGSIYNGPTYTEEYDELRALTSTDNLPTPSQFQPVDWDTWEKDNCTGCNIRSKPIHYMKECPIHGHNAAWKNVEAAYGLHYEEDCVACVINPNDIVWFNPICPVHSSLADGSPGPGPGIVHFGEVKSNAGLELVEEAVWLTLIEEGREEMEEKLRENAAWLEGLEAEIGDALLFDDLIVEADESDESDGFRELAEADYARAMAARFNGLRETIKELAELEKEHQTNFRPSRAWLDRMYKLEDECGGQISVGGLAADLGMLQKPLNPDTFLMLGGSTGQPMGTMSDPDLEDLVYYMKMDGSSVRLLSDRETELADQCNSLDECPNEDPDIGECPMHPNPVPDPEPEAYFLKTIRSNCNVCKRTGRVDYVRQSGEKIAGYYRDCIHCRPMDPIMDCRGGF